MDYRAFCSAAVISISFASGGPAHALPQQNSNDPALLALQRAATSDPNLKDVTFHVEHESERKIVYVTPATRKEQRGNLMRIGRPSCDMLENTYKMVYYMPTGDLMEAAKEPFSPFFDNFFGVPVRNMKFFFELQKQQQAYNALADAHPEVHQEFVRTKAAKESSQERAAILQRKEKGINDEIERMYRDIDAAETPEERSQRREMYRQLRAEKAQELREVAREIKKAENEVFAASKDFDNAQAAWAPYQRQQQVIRERMEEAQETVRVIKRIALDAFIDGEKSLNRYESIPVAYASAGYTIYDSEVSYARKYLQQNPVFRDYLVQEMPLNNVNLSMVRASFQYNSEKPEALGGPELTAVVNQGSEDVTPAHTGFVLEPAPAVFRDLEGKPLPFVQRSMNDSHGSGVFNALVSRGAFCTGESERKAVDYNADVPGIGEISFTGARFQERQVNVLAQAVALNYDYFVHAEPVAAECTANASSSLRFFSNHRVSRSFFNASAWDEATRKATEDHDIHCTITMQPTEGDSSPEAQRTRLQEIEQRMKQEIMAEFITSAGARWETVLNSSNVTADNLDGISRRGFAADRLCRRANYCEVGNLILDTARGLFGVHSNTTVVRNDQFVGSFRRSYKEYGYRRAKGVANIDLVVRL